MNDEEDRKEKEAERKAASIEKNPSVHGSEVDMENHDHAV